MRRNDLGGGESVVSSPTRGRPPRALTEGGARVRSRHSHVYEVTRPRGPHLPSREAETSDAGVLLLAVAPRSGSRAPGCGGATQRARRWCVMVTWSDAPRQTRRRLHDRGEHRRYLAEGKSTPAATVRCPSLIHWLSCRHHHPATSRPVATHLFFAHHLVGWGGDTSSDPPLPRCSFVAAAPFGGWP